MCVYILITTNIPIMMIAFSKVINTQASISHPKALSRVVATCI